MRRHAGARLPRIPKVGGGMPKFRAILRAFRTRPTDRVGRGRVATDGPRSQRPPGWTRAHGPSQARSGHRGAPLSAAA